MFYDNDMAIYYINEIVTWSVSLVAIICYNLIMDGYGISDENYVLSSFIVVLIPVLGTKAINLIEYFVRRKVDKNDNLDKLTDNVIRPKISDISDVIGDWERLIEENNSLKDENRRLKAEIDKRTKIVESRECE